MLGFIENLALAVIPFLLVLTLVLLLLVPYVERQIDSFIRQLPVWFAWFQRSPPRSCQFSRSLGLWSRITLPV